MNKLVEKNIETRKGEMLDKLIKLNHRDRKIKLLFEFNKHLSKLGKLEKSANKIIKKQRKNDSKKLKEELEIVTIEYRSIDGYLDVLKNMIEKM